MILLGLGSNLTGPWGTSEETVRQAVTALARLGVRPVIHSSLVRSKAFGGKAQPDFVNSVLQVDTVKPPESLLRICHAVERTAGRIRGQRWGPRVLDVDILVYHDVVRRQCRHGTPAETRPVRPPFLPHPGIPERAFVLHPIGEIAPRWHHPLNGQTARQMLLLLRSRRGGDIIANSNGKNLG